jgi:hypothetical protein
VIADRVVVIAKRQREIAAGEHTASTTLLKRTPTS